MNLGCDIVKISRFNNVTDSFLAKVLSKKEIEAYQKRKDKAAFLAGRFALKEAIIKTFHGEREVLMNEICITNDRHGVPICKYYDYAIYGTISHEKDYAIAYAVRKDESDD